MATHFLNFCKGLLIGALIIFITPFLFAILHNVGPHDRAQFAEAQRILAQRLMTCDNPEKRAVIVYTLWRYDKLGPFDVAVCSTIRCAGINAPWCPGITIDSAFLDDSEVLADLLLHEALHDYPPYFGHTQHKRLGVW